MLKEVPLLCLERRGHDLTHPIWIHDSDDEEAGNLGTSSKFLRRDDAQANKRTPLIREDRTSPSMLKRPQSQHPSSYKSAPKDTRDVVYPDLSSILQNHLRQPAQPMHQKQRPPAKFDRQAECGSIQYLPLSRNTRENQGYSSHKGARSRECLVCGDGFPVADLRFLSTFRLKENYWTEAKCPQSQCDVKLTYLDIQYIARPETFKQYDTFITRIALNADPDFHWCQKCDAGQIHIEGDIFVCAACGHKLCVKHGTTWHDGETCEEYDHRSSDLKAWTQRVQDAASVATISKLSKKCPGQSCGYNIEKNEGCNHMTCSQCHYEFCWICLCDYNSVRTLGNSAHATDCDYHTRRLG